MKDKKRLSKIYNSKIFWAIVSLILSLIIWSYVSGLDGSTMEKQFSGIELQFEGESLLLSQRGLEVTNVETTSVSVKIKGTRSVLGKINASDLTAVIDVSNINQPNDMAWTYEIVFPNNINTSELTIVSRSPETISFSVVKNETKTIPIKGSFEGTIAEGCVAEELVFEPSEIEISGPENIVSTIEYAWVSFGEDTEIDASYSANIKYTLMDKNGQAVSASDLGVSTDRINVTQPILKTKELPLELNIINGGGVTAADCKISIEPKSISVAADSRLIDDKTSLIIGTVDLASFTSSYEKVFTVELDDGIENLTGVTEATVKIEIPNVSTRTVRVTNISCKNCTSGFNAAIDTEAVEITLRSQDEDALAAVKPEDISIVVDLSDYGSTTGKVIANGKVIVSGSQNVGAIGDVKVAVTITSE